MARHARLRIRQSLALAIAVVVATGVRPVAGEDLQYGIIAVHDASLVEDDGDDVQKSRADGMGQALPNLSIGSLAIEAPSEFDDEPDAPQILWRLRHQGAQQMGQPLGYTSFGAMVPRMLDDGLWFTDGQFLLDNGGNPGGNVGLGRRWYDGDRDRIHGISLWYDLRQTDRHETFQQAALSLECLGDRWDLRGNYYAPLSDPVRAGGPVAYGPLMFEGHSLVRTVTTSNQLALQGVDAELARRLGDNNLWLHAGSYHYQRDTLQLYGVSGGVRGFIAPNLTADVTITNDRVFDTNVVFAVTWFLPGGTSRSAMPLDVAQRMWQPVDRRDAVTIADVAGPVSLETLHAPGGGDLRFVHLDSSAPPAGPGTHASPVATLAAAQAASGPGDILFAHSGSSFGGESIALQDGQKLLGEGIVQTIATLEAGTVVLPAGNGGVVIPSIVNAPGDAVRLASNTTVSGFVIQTPVGRAIVGQNLVGDARVERIQVLNAGGQGIAMDNIHGRLLADDVVINGAANEGMLLSLSNVFVTDATVHDLNIAGTAAPGFLAVNAGPAGAILRLNTNTSDSAQGFQLISGPAGLFELGGTLGIGGTYLNSDNGNVANNGNTTSGGAPVLNVNGSLRVVDPVTIPPP